MQQSTIIELGPHQGSSAAAYTKSDDDDEEQQTLLSSSNFSSSSAAGLRRRSLGRNHQCSSWSHYGGKIYYYLLRALAVVGIVAIVSPFLPYDRSVVDRVETETMKDMPKIDNMNFSLSSSKNTTDVVEVKDLTKDDVKQQQIANYIKGTAIIQNIHITHHAGTSVCGQMSKLGPTPGFACMGKGKGNATLEHPWPSDEALETSHIGLHHPEHNDTAAWVTFWRTYFHFKSMEFRHYPTPPKPNLHATNWEYENLVSMIVMRDPMERFMAGGKCGSFHGSLPDDPTNDTQELYWEYANSDCADNYALRVLANESNCANGEDTSISCLESAKSLLTRFTFILDQDCLADSMVALGNVLNLTITSSGFESNQHKKRDPLRDRFGNDTLYEYVKRRFRRDIELYEWSKKRSIVVCNK